MTDETENLVLEQLRAMRAEMAEMRREIKQRFLTLEIAVSGIESNLAGMRADLSHQSERIDRLERRLQLVDE